MASTCSRRRRARRLGWAAATVAMGVATLVACTSDDPEATTPPPGAFARPEDRGDDRGVALDDVEVQLTRIARTGDLATALMSDADRSALYVGQRSGRIMRIDLVERSGHLVPELKTTPVLDLSDQVSVDGERGLFDLQLLEGGDRALVSYTALDGALTVALLDVDAEAGSLSVADDATVLSIPHPYAGHNGGGLALTASGDALVSVGDMDLENSASPPSLDPTSPLGSVLRIPAAVLDDPSARPFEPTADDLVAKGLRNPWRISRDAATDDLWLGDVGESTWEEIDVLADVTERDDTANFGWPAFEGEVPYRDGLALGGEAEPVAPVWVYAHADDACAVTGGAVYRGDLIPQLDGAYLYGDFCSDAVRALRADGTEVVDRGTLGTVEGSVVSFGEDADGELYVLTSEGDVYRVDPAGWQVDDVTEGIEPTPTTTTTAPPPSSAECELAVSLLGFRGTGSPTPAEFEQQVTAIAALLDEVAATATPERQPDVAVAIEAFDALAETGAAHDWNADDPAVAGLMATITAGDEPWAGFPPAITAIVAAADACG